MFLTKHFNRAQWHCLLPYLHLCLHVPYRGLVLPSELSTDRTVAFHFDSFPSKGLTAQKML